MSYKRGSIQHLKSIVAHKNGRLTIDDFDLRATVGTGTFGRVRVVKVKGSSDRTPMALKILKKSEIIRLRQVEHVKAEKDILTSVEHPFIVNLVASFQDDKKLYMLMEYVNGGELFSYLRKVNRLQDNHARFYTSQIILAFQYLHQKKIIYRDLKPENLLIDVYGNIKITDFGFAKVVEDRTWTLCGTPEYLAPEIIQSKGHNQSVDWWSLGILIFEMLAGYPPFYDENPFGIYQKVLAGRIDFPKQIDVKPKDLIKKLLVHDRTRRLGCLRNGADDVKEHKWFRDIDWEAVFAKTVSPPFVPNVRSLDDTALFDKYPESNDTSSVAISAKDQAAYFDDF